MFLNLFANLEGWLDIIPSVIAYWVWQITWKVHEIHLCFRHHIFNKVIPTICKQKSPTNITIHVLKLWQDMVITWPSGCIMWNDAYLQYLSGGWQGFTPGFTETLMYHLRYTLIFIPDFVPQVCCNVKECNLCPWIKRNNLHYTFFMWRNGCHLFGIEFVF